MGRDAKTPETRGLILITLRSAAEEMFGAPALAAIAARLPADVRAATIDSPPLTFSWYPTSYVVVWWEAVLAFAGNDDAVFCSFVDRSNELGFGRVRRTLLGFVGPAGLVGRAAELWRHDHTTGTLEVVETLEAGADGSGGGVKAALRDHPFGETEVARRGLAEALRYILSLARGVNEVTVAYGVEDGALVMTFRWR
jgi:hypothetical protein